MYKMICNFIYKKAFSPSGFRDQSLIMYYVNEDVENGHSLTGIQIGTNLFVRNLRRLTKFEILHILLQLSITV